jgi:hypothetical protein
MRLTIFYFLHLLTYFLQYDFLQLLVYTNQRKLYTY